MGAIEVFLFRSDWAGEDWAQLGVLGKLRKIAVQLAHRTLKGGINWTAGLAETGEETTPQSFAYLGWSFFILLIVAGYTANLAAFLTRGCSSPCDTAI